MASSQKSETPRTKAELLSVYADPTWRSRYLEVSDLRDFLRGCILSKGYTIPDSMNNAIHLSEAGSRIQQTLHTKHSVPVKEARVLCFLHLAHVDPLVDLERTDPEPLRESINEQIIARKILFPHSYGRLLYDKCADLHQHETPRLSFEETIQLLDGTPIGFSQLGDWTTGPFGLVKSEQARWIQPRRRIPLYHCSSIACSLVHSTELETNHSAAINQFSDQFDRTIRAISERPSEWRQFEAELVKADKHLNNDRSQMGTHWLLGDSLSAEELQTLVTYLLDEEDGKGDFRARIASIGLSGRSTDIVKDLSAADLLQLVMLARDETLVSSIDRLVRAGKIGVPGEEIRRPVLNAGQGTGRFALLPELSAQGVRFLGGFEDLAPLRLKRLIRKLYPTRDEGDVIEFDWQLRGTDATTAAGKLEQFIRSNTPEQVVKRLVLATRANVITSCVELAIDIDDYENDDLFVRKVLWKLGYPPRSAEDFNGNFWRFHEEMSKLSQTAGISAVVDESAVRSLATNYFVELEGVLDDALAFIVWLLLLEHMSETEPFTYHVDRDRTSAFDLLNSISASRVNEQECIQFSDRNELYPLCRGFAILADHLESLGIDPSARRRPEAELPVGAHGSDLKTYPFLHYDLVLDLTESSRRNIIDLLRETSRRLTSEDVPSVRNSWQHYRRSTVPLEPLVSCLQTVSSVVSSLEAAGMCRIMYSHTGVSFDGWGRGFFRFEDCRGREISIATPTTLDIGALPGPTTPQYLVTRALLSDSGDFVRCRREEASEFSKEWAGFPIRRHESKAEDPAGGDSPDMSDGPDTGA
jgi:hypothetical protein